MNAKGLVTAIGLALLGVTVLQARSMQPPVAAAAPATALPVGIAAEGRVVAYPGAEVKVAAERGGRLVRMLVEENQVVRRGQVLAELESDELQASLEEARARVAEGEAEAKLAEANLRRRQQLRDEQIVADADVDQARRDLEVAAARVTTARASVARYEAQLRKTKVLAPIAGTVTHRHVDGGETVAEGEVVATLADLSKLRIEGEADEADAGAVKPGAEVSIRADGWPGKSFRGRVEEVADSVTPRRLKPQDPARPTDTRILAVKVAFVDPAPLKLGTTVDLRIAPAR
jgi:RND family efflux transporter MFP subunit